MTTPADPTVYLLAKEICSRMAKGNLSGPPIDTGRPPELVAKALAYAVAKGWLTPEFALTGSARKT